MTELALPSYLPHRGAAVVRHGRRTLTWTLHEPGEIHRNRYAMAWIDCAERDPWSGEPLSCWGQRRQTMESPRVSFTDAAQRLLRQDINTAVSRYGFARLWAEQFGQTSHGDNLRRQVERSRIEASWWEMKADLADMLGDGLIEFVDATHYSSTEVRVLAPWTTSGRTKQAVIARAMLDGAHVGWLTRDGDLVPTEGVLDG